MVENRCLLEILLRFIHSPVSQVPGQKEERREKKIQGACGAHLRRQEGGGDSRAARLCPPDRSPGRAEATVPTSRNAALPRFFFFFFQLRAHGKEGMLSVGTGRT